MMKKNIHMLIASAAFLVVSTMTGCIFDTRDAAQPTSGSTWRAPSTPQVVLKNMETGMADLTGANYERSIADKFEFIPLEEDKQNSTLTGQFENWTAAVEKEVLQIILSPASVATASFTIDEQTIDTTTEAEFIIDYTLNLTRTAGPEPYAGKARFKMENVNGSWQLVLWRDEQLVGGSATWGFLRGDSRPRQ
jgi:hypothetical protein